MLVLLYVGKPKAWSGGAYREISSIPIPLSKLLSPGIGSSILRAHPLYESLPCFFHRPLLAPQGRLLWGLVLGRGG